MPKKTYFLPLLALALSGCSSDLDLGRKSDVELCVDAHLARYEIKRQILSAAHLERTRVVESSEAGAQESAANLLPPQKPNEAQVARFEAAKERYEARRAKREARLAKFEATLAEKEARELAYDAAERKAEFYLLCLHGAKEK